MPTLTLRGATVILVFFGSLATSAAADLSRSGLIARLKGLQAKQVQELANVETTIRKRLQESTGLSLKGDLNDSAKKVKAISDQIEALDERRLELGARRQFFDQLIFQVDTKWSGQALQTFLEHRFLDMATGDLTGRDQDVRLWKFLVYASIVIREIPDQREDAIGVVESYLDFSGVLDPKSPAEFAANRNYTGKAGSAAAQPVKREELGDYLESRLEDLGIKKKKAPRTEINVKLEPPPPPKTEPSPTPPPLQEEVKP